MFPWVCTCKRSQKKSKCDKKISDSIGCASCATFLFLPNLAFICDLLLNRRTPKWNRFIELKLSCCAKGNKPEVKWCLCMPFPLRWYFCVASKVDIGQVGSVGFVSTKSGLAFPISYHLAYSVDNSTWYDYQENGSRKVFRI